MNPAESSGLTGISAEAMRDVAASGAVCEECGGLCIPSIDVAILAVSAAKNAEVTIPFCVCMECRVCGPFRQAVAALKIREPETQRAEAHIHD